MNGVAQQGLVRLAIPVEGTEDGTEADRISHRADRDSADATATLRSAGRPTATSTTSGSPTGSVATARDRHGHASRSVLEAPEPELPGHRPGCRQRHDGQLQVRSAIRRQHGHVAAGHGRAAGAARVSPSDSGDPNPPAAGSGDAAGSPAAAAVTAVGDATPRPTSRPPTDAPADPVARSTATDRSPDTESGGSTATEGSTTNGTAGHDSVSVVRRCESRLVDSADERQARLRRIST